MFDFSILDFLILELTSFLKIQRLVFFNSKKIVQFKLSLYRKHSVNPLVKCDRESTDHQSDLSNFDRRIYQPTAYSLQPTASIRPVGRIVTLYL